MRTQKGCSAEEKNFRRGLGRAPGDVPSFLKVVYLHDMHLQRLTDRATLMIAVTTIAACSELRDYEPPDFGKTSASSVDRIGGFEASKRSELSTEKEPAESIENARQLAYTYTAGLALPPKNVTQVARSHEDRCRTAGPSVCQVVSSSVREQNEDYVYAELEIRAQRGWMTAFRQGLSQEATSAAGRLQSTTTRAEDLTRVITDTSARLQAQRTLRERLLKLLDRETDKVGELLQIERELARVQGEIESTDSYLKVLRGRVAMDRMSLRYEALRSAVSESAIQPVLDACTDFLATLSQSFAVLVLFVAGTLPWLLLGLPSLWISVRILRWITKRRPAKKLLSIPPNEAPQSKEENLSSGTEKV